eukprot:11234_1
MVSYSVYLCSVWLCLLLLVLPFECTSLPDINKSRNCTCFDPETAALLHNAHTFMEEQHASTLIAYLNEQNNTEATRQYIHRFFLDSFHLYYSLYDNVKDDHFWDSGCKLRNPLGWYLGHTASFYNNKLRINSVIDHGNNTLYTEYDYFFAQGVDEFDWFDYRDQHPVSYWPHVAKVKRYVRDTKDVVSNLILTAPLTSLPITKSNRVWWTIVMGIDHERIHLETSAMLIRQLPLHKCKADINNIWSHVFEGYEELERNIPPNNQLIPIQGRQMTYGRASDELISDSVTDFFGWDIEYGSYTVDVTDFNVSKYMVSNYEFYQFYQQNGYSKQKYWDDTAWRWVQETHTTHPKFWIKNENSESPSEFRLRNTFSEIDMSKAWNRPVITNHYEADAFIRWKSEQLDKDLRLITEDEWNVLRSLPSGLEFARSNIREWDEIYGEFIANTNYYYYSGETPVDMFEFGNSSVYDVVGNLWHHTSSHFHPFNGYEIDPLYAYFTTPFFNSSYFLMKGGSYLSSGNMAMLYNRNQWFRAHYFQAAGIRYVESARISHEENNRGKQTTEEYFRTTDESNAAVYESIHWLYSLNAKDDNYRHMVADNVQIAVQLLQGKTVHKVLDIGCAVGGVAYELLRRYPEMDGIIGVDDRARFVGLANRMQQSRALKYKLKNKFGKEEPHVVSLEQLDMETLPFHKIRFVQDKDLQLTMGSKEKYDVIVGENMFARYYKRLRENTVFALDRLLVTDGMMILFEDYESWNTEGIEDVMEAMQAIVGNDMVLKKQFDTGPIARSVYQSSRIVKQCSFHCTVWVKTN